MIRHRFLALLGAACALALPCAVRAESLPPDQAALVDRSVTAELARDRVPGASIAIARGGELLYAHGYGFRDVASKAPVDTTTVFEIGSVTKQFTAAAVMQLVQAGKVDLDKPVGSYVKGIPSGDRITVRELLGQTSGLPNYTDQASFTSLAQKAVKPKDIVASIAALPLAFEPGTRWQYSNTNYVVLGMLIERISGQSYPQYVASHLLAPLSLWKTRYSGIYLDAGDVALPYGPAGGNQIARLDAINLDWAYAAGAMWSSAPDLVRWEDALFSGRVVDRRSLETMTTAGALPGGASTGYGYGLMVSTAYGEHEIWHTGGLPGYGSIDAYFPSEHLEIAVLGNAVTFNGTAVVRSVLAALVPSVAAKIAAEASATPAPGEDSAMTKLAISLVAQAQKGVVDRSLLDASMSAALTPDAIAHVAAQIAPLGAPKTVTFIGGATSGGYRDFHYRVVWDTLALDESFALDSDGKIAGWFFRPATDATAAPTGGQERS